MILTIGTRHRIEVRDFEEASEVYCRLRDESGEGGSSFPAGRLPGHYISYNGRIWKGSPRAWKPGDRPAFDPFAVEAKLEAIAGGVA